MRVVWVGTRPPVPPLDGGRLVALRTIEALTTAGAKVTVIAPRQSPSSVPDIGHVATVYTSDRPTAWPLAILRGLRTGRPATIERHAAREVAAVVGDLLARTPFDIVHVEQPHALAGAAAARARGLACIVRTHNVESEVWEDAADYRPWPLRSLMRAESRRLRRFEGTALTDVDAVIALSARDARRLRAIAPAARIHVVPPPAPILSESEKVEGVRALDGEPALVWIGTRGWPPNEAAVDWLVTAIWPTIRERLPNARLHAFGAGALAVPGLVSHDAPADSATAFPRQSTLLLPLRRAAGVRMRVLEAWGRGVPVVATRAALEGLETADGENVLIADDAPAFAQAIERLSQSVDVRARLVEGGYGILRRRHDPADIARLTLGVYSEAIARRAAR